VTEESSRNKQDRNHRREEILSAFSSLGLPPTATKDEVRRKFRKLAFVFHPDRNKNVKAQDTFTLLHQAYQLLLTTLPDSGSYVLAKEEELDKVASVNNKVRRDQNPYVTPVAINDDQSTGLSVMFVVAILLLILMLLYSFLKVVVFIYRFCRQVLDFTVLGL
jgi:DnaJ domain